MVVYNRMLLLATAMMLVGVMAACGDKQPQSAASPTAEAVQSALPAEQEAVVAAAATPVSQPSPTASPSAQPPGMCTFAYGNGAGEANTIEGSCSNHYAEHPDKQ